VTPKPAIGAEAQTTGAAIGAPPHLSLGGLSSESPSADSASPETLSAGSLSAESLSAESLSAENGSSGRGPAEGPAPVVDNVRFAALRRSPLLRRITGYSAGSVIAAFTSELAFAGAFGWLHSGTTWASLAGFIGGAVPNYFLNRRWAWQGRSGRSRRSEITLYAIVSIASFLVSAVVTNVVERWARHLTTSASLRVVVVATAYLAVSGVFFVGKFVAYELIVFTKGPGERAGSSSRSDEPSTTSSPPPA
jgi:putative flippase GtrA